LKPSLDYKENKLKGFSTRRMTDKDWAQLKYFVKAEFREPNKMGYEFMLWLEKVRALAGVAMNISSGFRSPAYNKSVGGAADSAHTDGDSEDECCNAVDIRKTPTPNDPHWNHARYKIQFSAHDLGCERFGNYPNGSMHIDRTEDKRPAESLWVAVDNKA